MSLRLSLLPGIEAPKQSYHAYVLLHEWGVQKWEKLELGAFALTTEGHEAAFALAEEIVQRRQAAGEAIEGWFLGSTPIVTEG